MKLYRDGKKWLKNLSLQRKMVLSLVVLVILPILLLGTVMLNQIAKLSLANQYEIQMNQLIRIGKEIESAYSEVLDSARTLADLDSVQRIVRGIPEMRDYVTAGNAMNSAADTISCRNSISLTVDGMIRIQRGADYLKDDAVEKEGSSSYWRTEQLMDYQFGSREYTLPVFSWHQAIIDSYSMKRLGMLHFYVNTEDILSKFKPYNEDILSDIILFNAQGDIMMSLHPDRDGGIYWEELKKHISADYGYYYGKGELKDKVIMHTGCGSSGWYLMQADNRQHFFLVRNAFLIGILLFCLLFGIVYGYIQYKTTIIPLRSLSLRIAAVQEGDFAPQSYVTSEDEVGYVQRGFENMVSQLNELINQVYVETIKRQEAEHKNIVEKLNPHFLYNSLDSIHWLAFQNRDYEVSEQLETLADVYRHLMKFGEEMIGLDEEVEFLKKYTYLLNSQRDKKIEFIFEIPEELLHSRIPKLLLQPLLENAVGHGLWKDKEGGKVKIRASRSGGILSVTVIDNGNGCDAGEVMRCIREQDTEKAYALCNVDARIKLMYGADFGIQLFSKKGWGCIVKVRMNAEEVKA